METTNPIDQYQANANMTCSPLDESMLFRMAQCSQAISHMTDLARPALALADVIKKYVFYNREPKVNIPYFIKAPTGDMPTILKCTDTQLQARMDLFHAFIGILTEGEEILTHTKSIARGGPPVGVEFNAMMQNSIEEGGDVLWYVALMCRALGLPLSVIMDANIEKLNKKRFKGGVYSDQAANNRDTKAEMDAINDVVEAVVVPRNGFVEVGNPSEGPIPRV